jgi:hypothetical protein
MAKPFNVLLDKPPEDVWINGRQYKINTDFRVVLAYLREMENEGHTEDERNGIGLALFFGEEVRAGDLEDLAKALEFFITRGEAAEEEDEGPKRAPVFDFLTDSGRIYAAFLQVYGVNLRQVKVHWWVFKDLLDGLPSGTKLEQVIEIRRRPFEKGMKPAEKNELQRMKDIYRIGEKRDVLSDLFTAISGVATRKQ